MWNRKMRSTLIIVALTYIIAGCSSSRPFSAQHKYSPKELEEDYFIYQRILELHHPGLYWYTSKDSMSRYFDYGRQQIKDSLTEPQFRKILNYVTAKIDCGHTTVRSSKAWDKYSDTARVARLFPLSMKVWDSAMVVAVNLNRRDTVLKRGTVITSINGRTWKQIVDTMFNYISTDGYNTTSKYQSLSNRGFFGSLYTSLFGLSDFYTVDYLAVGGQPRSIIIPVYNAATDTAGRSGSRPIVPRARPSRKERKELQLNSVRLLRMDTVNRTAMMTLGSFGRGYGLRRFFRNSYRALQAHQIDHLIIDLRSNGGGSVSNSTLATRYIANHRFKIADSLYAIRKHSPYVHYVADHLWTNLFITLLTKKKSDGNYHFGYFERHFFEPKKKFHYSGQVYLLTGGNSFSATTLFTAALVNQDNVITVGEETGGGAYGNSAWLIPDVTLPNTHVRFRLPVFRLVIDKNTPKNGRGVQPEVPSFPTAEAIKKNIDYKLEKAMELIRIDKEKKK
jgi:hypothetical protein